MICFEKHDIFILIVVLLNIYSGNGNETFSLMYNDGGSSGCRLPPLPDYGSYKVGEDANPTIGEEVPDYTTLLYSCSDGFIPSLENVFCINQAWSGASRCIECGLNEMIKEETMKERNIVPWYVAIYKTPKHQKISSELICGGSLVTAHLVITAANCFFIPKQSGPIPASLCSAVAGKLHEVRDHPQDRPNLQISQVKEIHLAEGYAGSKNNEENDLAILELETPFQISQSVHPVCLDLDTEDMDLKDLNAGSAGKVSGWTLPRTASDGFSKGMLRTANFPVVSISECKMHSCRFRFNKFITNDKICAGNPKDTYLCLKDSGTGLVFPKMDSQGVQRWYLRGVVSARVQGRNMDTCRLGAYTLFTRIHSHKNWISNIVPQNKFTVEQKKKVASRASGNKGLNAKYSSKDGCKLPKFLVGGHYTVMQPGFENALPGDMVPFSTTLQYTCDDGYAIEKSLSICMGNLGWSSNSICEKQCIIPSYTEAYLEAKYYDNGEWKIAEGRVSSGTNVLFDCKRFYIRNVDIYDLYCNNGKFNSSIPKCSTDCGEEISEGVANIINGEQVQQGFFPWQVGIYQDFKKVGISHICGGSLIRSNLVCSAAHCFTNSENGDKRPPEIFHVAVGKKYRSWDHTEDEKYEFVQKGRVKKIYIPDYSGDLQHFQNDIAVIELMRPFKFYDYVHAVCIDLNRPFEFNNQRDRIFGKIAGWGFTTEGGNPSEELMKLNMPVRTSQECREEFKKYNFMPYYTSDKICAGYTNGSLVCSGDSGGGLVFSIVDTRDRGKRRWYLRGLVSTAPVDSNGCRNNTYSTFTQIHVHRDWIRDVIIEAVLQTTEELSQREIGCRLPKSPELGNYVARNYKDALPGDVVVSGTMLEYFCVQGYKPTANTATCMEDFTWSASVLCINSAQLVQMPPLTVKTRDCRLPPFPINGNYSMLRPGVDPSPGNMVPEFTAITASCYDGYDIVSGIPWNFCGNTSWAEEMIVCEKRCDVPNNTSQYLCSDSGQPCGGQVTSRFGITIQCHPGYHSDTGNPYVACQNGKFQGTIPKCIPRCGMEPRENKDTITFESDTYTIPQHTHWHAGIYQTIEDIESMLIVQVCGGSLIHKNLVLTAAHCFYDELSGGLYSFSDFNVGIGKLIKDWNHPVDKSIAKKSRIQQVFIPKTFSGEMNFMASDIAIVKLKKSFELSDTFYPICLNLVSVPLEMDIIQTNKVAKLTAWGSKTIDGKSSRFLQSTELTVLDKQECLKGVAKYNMTEYMSNDKVCMKYLNETSMCGSIGGEGMFFQANDPNDGKPYWYLGGVYSVGISTIVEFTCKPDDFSLYTRIFEHREWIKQILTDNDPDKNTDDNKAKS